EFWIIFDQNWKTSIRVCPTAPNNSSSKSRAVTAANTVSGTNSGQGFGKAQKFERGKDGNSEGDRERDNGEPSKYPDPPADATQPIGFACPYRKHNPRKYCVTKWRSCALSPLKTVARVKGHLYRYHIINQCQRCKYLFDSEEELNSHIETSERCEAILAPPVDGITWKMKRVLQCKRKAFPGQTEAERWKQIYRILFPDEEVPDPYFEQVRDSEESRPLSPGLTNIANYEQYLRCTLPRLVRNALVTELNNEIQPIEERLREQLPDLVE
ncbi:hypothetical protein N431DRAFT_282195, partial [Stipitochalara longipes BDJ]